MDERSIIAMGEMEYKSHIKKHIEKAAFGSLKKIQEPHKKVNNIKYESLTIQPYMTSHELKNHEVTLLTALRSYTVRGIRMNFSSWYKPNLLCPLNCRQQDSQSHLLSCEILLTELTQDQLKLIQELSYEDLYHGTERQKLAVTGFTWLLDIRERLLEAASPASGATLVATSSPGRKRGLA